MRFAGMFVTEASPSSMETGAAVPPTIERPAGRGCPQAAQRPSALWQSARRETGEQPSGAPWRRPYVWSLPLPFRAPVVDQIARLQAALNGRYTIERELGHVGMATVYLAHDLKHHRQVAIKVLKAELAVALGPERFLREIEIAARLNLPHILALHDSGDAAGFLYFVMPYVEGESLRQRLVREKQLFLEDAIHIACAVASALSYAHNHNVVHRDIKPENVLLSGGEAVVADFGIARAITAAGGDKLTTTGVAVGTPTYMSPEQAAGEAQLDGRSDVYSLGCVLYEMLAGHPPLLGASAQEILARHTLDPVPPIRTARATVSGAVEQAIVKSLAKQPADRFAAAAQFAEALNAAGAPRSPARWRSPRWVGVVVLGAVALAAFAAVWHPWRRPARAVAPVADVGSVAVLPFDNLTGNPSDRYLSDGMTEEVIGQLAQVRGLKVISRTSSEALKGTHLTLRQVADTLGVRHILEGSVRHAGNRIRVAVDLIDATSDAHVWASSYDRDLTDVFAVQEEIARHVADSLVRTVGIRPTLSHGSRTERAGACEAYLSARSLIYRRTREGLRGAKEQFERAIALDPTYAPAYAGLASVYPLWATFAYSGIDFYEGYGQAIAKADRAIALDPELAEAYATRGYIMTRAWGPAGEIAADFNRALELRPNSADVHQWYARFLTRQERYDEALAEVERAVALDPLAPGVRVAFALDALAARRYDVAAQEAERVVALEPSLVAGRGLEGLGKLLSGHPDRCATLGLGPYVGVRAMCLHSLGKVGEAARLADSLHAAFAAGATHDSAFSPVLAARGLAEYYAWTGDARQALTWLERAYAISPEGEFLGLIATGIYDRVREDPRFKAGLERERIRIYDRVRRARREVGP